MGIFRLATLFMINAIFMLGCRDSVLRAEIPKNCVSVVATKKVSFGKRIIGVKHEIKRKEEIQRIISEVNNPDNIYAVDKKGFRVTPITISFKKPDGTMVKIDYNGRFFRWNENFFQTRSFEMSQLIGASIDKKIKGKASELRKRFPELKDALPPGA